MIGIEEVSGSEDLLDISPKWFSEYSDVDSSEDQSSWDDEQDQRSEIISYLENLSKGRRSFIHGHRAIIERAYRFINDEIFSSETGTDESETENEEIMKFLSRKRKFPLSLKARGSFGRSTELREIGKSFKKSLKKITGYSKFGFQKIFSSYDKEEKISDDESMKEAKLLSDIKRRIDEYFENDFAKESSNMSDKSLSLLNCEIVKSNDSGVSADFLVSNKITENRERTDDLSFADDIYYYPKDISLPDEKVLLDDDNEEVEKAMQKLTEELIICERKAIDRGFIISVEKNTARKKAKFIPAGSPENEEDDISWATEFSSEEEYLENISPPSMISSISDSEFGD